MNSATKIQCFGGGSVRSYLYISNFRLTVWRFAICDLRGSVYDFRRCIRGKSVLGQCYIRVGNFGLRFAVCDLRFAIYGLRFTVCDLRFAVCGLRFTVCGLRFTVCGLRFAVYGLRFTIYGLRF